MTLRKLPEEVRPEIDSSYRSAASFSGDLKVAILAPKAGKAALVWAGSGP